MCAEFTITKDHKLPEEQFSLNLCRELGITDPNRQTTAFKIFLSSVIDAAKREGFVQPKNEHELYALRLGAGEIFVPDFKLEKALWQTFVNGYCFAKKALDPGICQALIDEVDGLILEEGDHITHPINAGSSLEVKQLHERYYCPVWEDGVTVARAVANSAAGAISQLTQIDTNLSFWWPNEVGYQRYRNYHDRISPHRDRRTDQILAFTLTIAGSAKVKIYEPYADPDDYTKLHLVDEVMTESRSVMFLRAPGFGNGQQVIHEVCPPEEDSRLILNLRMRPDILPKPSETIQS